MSDQPEQGNTSTAAQETCLNWFHEKYYDREGKQQPSGQSILPACKDCKGHEKLVRKKKIIRIKIQNWD